MTALCLLYTYDCSMFIIYIINYTNICLFFLGYTIAPRKLLIYVNAARFLNSRTKRQTDSSPIDQEGKLSVSGERKCKRTGLPLRGLSKPSSVVR